MASRARRVDTRRCSHFWPVHSSWRAAFAPEQSHREFAPADAAVGTQDAALQIAWISSKLLVCSCRRLLTKSVNDIEIAFSSRLSLGFALQRLVGEGIRAHGLRLRRQRGVRHPGYALTGAARERRSDWRLVRNRAMCVHVRGSRLTGGLPSAPIAA
jgi:hypothetical protein